MLSCKEVSLLLSMASDQNLRWGQRLAVRLHLLYCRGCARFAKHLQFLRAAGQRLAQSDAQAGTATLSTAARKRIRAALQRD